MRGGPGRWLVAVAVTASLAACGTSAAPDHPAAHTTGSVTPTTCPTGVIPTPVICVGTNGGGSFVHHVAPSDPP